MPQLSKAPRCRQGRADQRRDSDPERRRRRQLRHAGRDASPAPSGAPAPGRARRAPLPPGTCRAADRSARRPSRLEGGSPPRARAHDGPARAALRPPRHGSPVAPAPHRAWRVRSRAWPPGFRRAKGWRRLPGSARAVAQPQALPAAKRRWPQRGPGGTWRFLPLPRRRSAYDPARRRSARAGRAQRRQSEVRSMRARQARRQWTIPRFGPILRFCCKAATPAMARGAAGRGCGRAFPSVRWCSSVGRALDS
jgi:hypothetical protein